MQKETKKRQFKAKNCLSLSRRIECLLMQQNRKIYSLWNFILNVFQNNFFHNTTQSMLGGTVGVLCCFMSVSNFLGNFWII